jgi:hypothetical protein
MLQNGDQFIRSNEKASTAPKTNPNRVGMNGYGGASSTPLDKPVTSNFLPKLNGDLVKAKSVNTQNRVIDPMPLKPAFGHKGAAAGPKVPPNNRPVTK